VTLRQLLVAALLWFVTFTSIYSSLAEAPRLPRYTVLELHERLVMAGRKASAAFEATIENGGGVDVEGVVGAIDVPIADKSAIWMSATAGGELIGKVLIDVPSPAWRAPLVGIAIVVRCRRVARSYALVFGLCNAP
jgi:hypothetical protein